jgi:hypothetical protein
MAGMAQRAGPVPRRGRHLIPTGLPRRGELVAVCAVAILVAHLLLAQLTLVLALVLAAIGKTSRWRPWWLLVPAVAGLAWTLAAGPGNALAGFAAGPASILAYLSGGHLAGHPGHPLAAFAGVQSWLPRQFPVALVTGAAEAALIGWLDWLHTDEWAVPPPRPGAVTAVRRALAANAVRAGGVVTRDGCALGVVPATGAVAELRWAEVSHGTLIVGAAAQDVTLAGLQVMHAALRRRKPVIVLDSGHASIARALAAACAATGTPLLAASSSGRGPVREREPDDQVTSELGRVVRERLAVLLPVDTTELAVRACDGLASLARDLRRIGVDGDAIVWVPHGERIPGQALAELLRDGPEAGLAVLTGTTSPVAATELSSLAGTALICRVTDPELAASLAARTGPRLLPRPVAASLAGQPAGIGLRPAVPRPGEPVYPGATVHPAAPADDAAAGADLVAGPVVPARALLSLGQAEFVLAVSAPRQRLIALGQLVPARLPRPTARPAARQGAAT